METRSKEARSMLRLNIHLALDEHTTQFCQEVNTTIRRITHSAIVFSKSSPMIPHMTLVMGELLPSQTVEAVATATTRLAEQMKPLRFQLDQPHISPFNDKICDLQYSGGCCADRVTTADACKHAGHLSDQPLCPPTSAPYHPGSYLPPTRAGLFLPPIAP